MSAPVMVPERGICIVDEAEMLCAAACYAEEWGEIDPNAVRVGELVEAIADGDAKIDGLAALFSKKIATVQYRRWERARASMLSEIAVILDEEGC